VLIYLHSSSKWGGLKGPPFLFASPLFFQKKGHNFSSLSINVFQDFVEYISAWGKQGVLILLIALQAGRPKWVALFYCQRIADICNISQQFQS
jgi:hypothetical protein